MIEFEMTGLKEVQKILEDFTPRHANNIFRNTVRGIAAEIAKEAKKRVSTDTKNLKKSIKVRSRRSVKGKPIFIVYFTSGRDAKHDGFYWRFVEHGTVKNRANPFFQPAVNFVTSQQDRIISQVFTKKVEQAVNRELKKQARNK